MITVPDTIVCVECRGTCHRLGDAPHDGWEPGDWVAYRCPECLDRFDLQVPDEDDDDAAGDGSLRDLYG